MSQTTNEIKHRKMLQNSLDEQIKNQKKETEDRLDAIRRLEFKTIQAAERYAQGDISVSRSLNRMIIAVSKARLDMQPGLMKVNENPNPLTNPF